MAVKQLSIFLENKSGRLKDVSGLLETNNINIRALALADTLDFGILRLIVDDCNKATEILKKNDFTVKETEVIAVEVEDQPGGLNKILTIFDKNNINIEYMYAFVEKSQNNAVVIFRIDDSSRAVSILEANNIKTLTNDMIKVL